MAVFLCLQKIERLDILRNTRRRKPLLERHSPRQREFFTSIVSLMFCFDRVSYGREGCEYNTRKGNKHGLF
nr:MAG TPA: hypothetical protein [Caudoviricetes sp.]